MLWCACQLLVIKPNIQRLVFGVFFFGVLGGLLTVSLGFPHQERCVVEGPSWHHVDSLAAGHPLCSYRSPCCSIRHTIALGPTAGSVNRGQAERVQLWGREKDQFRSNVGSPGRCVCSHAIFGHAPMLNILKLNLLYPNWQNRYGKTELYSYKCKQ